MHNGLLVAKRLFMEASSFTDRPDPVSAGIAISMLQDAVETYLWTLIKDRGIGTNERDGFVDYIKKLSNADVEIPHRGELFDLNKARVNFKHNANLPAPEEAKKHKWAVEQFFRTAVPAHFEVSFDEISLVQLVGDGEIRDHLAEAQKCLDHADLKECAEELAKAKALLFRQFNRYIPEASDALRGADRIFEAIPGGRTVRPFAFLAKYLDVLREAALVSLLHLPLREYRFLREGLPTANQSISGKWYLHHTRSGYVPANLQRAIESIVNLCIRAESIQLD